MSSCEAVPTTSVGASHMAAKSLGRHSSSTAGKACAPTSAGCQRQRHPPIVDCSNTSRTIMSTDSGRGGEGEAEGRAGEGEGRAGEGEAEGRVQQRGGEGSGKPRSRLSRASLSSASWMRRRM